MIARVAWWPVLLLVAGWLALAWTLARRERAARARALAALGDPGLLARLGRLPDPALAARRHWLVAAAVACALVALARPQGGTVSRTGEGMGRDVLMALDLSRSMTVRDGRPDRLTDAKRTARDLAAALDAGDRVGLVVFGGAGFLQLPLTTDRDALQRFLDVLTVELLDDPSTDLTAPLRAAATVFAHSGGEGHRALVVLSDGDDEVEHREAAIALMRKARVPVFAVGIGTVGGGYVPKAPGDTTGGEGNPWHVDGIGRPVVSKLEPAPLEEIARGTGGLYAAATDRDGMRRITEALRGITARPLGVQRRTERVELFQWPLGVAVVLLVVAMGRGGEPRYGRREGGPRSPPRHSRESGNPDGVSARDGGPVARPPSDGVPVGIPAFAGMTGGKHHGGASATSARTLPLALLLTLLPSCAGGRLVLDAGTRAYLKGDHDTAIAEWREDLAKRPSPALHYNLGNALFRAGRYEVAVREFAAAAVAPGPLRTQAKFNEGTAALRAAEQGNRKDELLDRAIASFEEVLERAPGDSAARWNLELALRRRGDRDTGGSPGRGGRAQAGRGDGREEGLNDSRETAVAAMAGGGSGSMEGESAKEISEQEARRQLDALERELLSSHEGRQTKRGQRSDRDW